MRSASAHSTGLDRVRRNDLEIVGEVEAGRPVQHAAVPLDQAVELALRQVLGALEHHVFEQVGEAGPIVRLDAEPDVVAHGDHGPRRGGVARENDPQPVVEPVVFDGHGARPRSAEPSNLLFRRSPVRTLAPFRA
jgi:hypothetical protein